MNDSGFADGFVLPARSRPRRGAPEILFFEELEDDAAPPPEPTEPSPPEPAAAPPPALLNEDDLARARAEGFAHGSSVGHAQAVATREQMSAAAVARIATLLDGAGDVAARASEESAAVLAKLLLTLLSQMLPALCARHGAAEAAALARAILPGFAHETLATVRVHSHALPELALVLASLGEQGSRLRLVGSDSLAPSDLRVEWPRGGAIRDATAIWAQINEVLAPLGLGDPSLAQAQVEA